MSLLDHFDQQIPEQSSNASAILVMKFFLVLVFISFLP